MPTSSTPPRTRSPPAQGSSALPPTTCRDYPEVGISPITPTSGLLDNYQTHKTSEIKRWLLRHPRFHLHLTPTYSSWLNLVERWFAELTNRKLRRSAHRSVAELEADITAWIDAWNDDPKPFVWTKTADEILDSLAGYLHRINNSGH